MIIFLTAASNYNENFSFEYLYFKYKNMVWHQIEDSTIADSGLKEEVMQDVFVKLYRTMGGFQSEKAIKRWLKLVTKSTIIDAGKKMQTYKKHISITLDDDDVFEECMQMLENKPLDDIIKREMVKAVIDEVKKLKPIYCEVIMLYYYAEFTVKEIAERLHIPENTVYSRLSKARSILYDAIGDSVRAYFIGGDVSDG